MVMTFRGASCVARRGPRVEGDGARPRQHDRPRCGPVPSRPDPRAAPLEEPYHHVGAYDKELADRSAPCCRMTLLFQSKRCSAGSPSSLAETWPSQRAARAGCSFGLILRTQSNSWQRRLLCRWRCGVGRCGADCARARTRSARNGSCPDGLTSGDVRELPADQEVGLGTATGRPHHGESQNETASSWSCGCALPSARGVPRPFTTAGCGGKCVGGDFSDPGEVPSARR